MDLKFIQHSIPLRENLLKIEREIYIVGGTVRDFLLNRPINDYDIVIPRNAMLFAQKLKRIVPGKIVPLSEEDDDVRFVIKHNLWIDISGRKGGDINEDLKRRDFTINAMAIPLHGEPVLIDPCSGKRDLLNGIIRTPQRENLSNDPLRILRAFRFMAELRFEIERNTWNWVWELGFRLRKPSKERIRYELFLIFGSSYVYSTLLKMRESKILEVLFPEMVALEMTSQRYYQEQNLLYHSLQTVRNLENLLDNLTSGPLKKYSRYIEAFLKFKNSKALMMMGALFHDLGKPATISVTPEGRTRFFDHDSVGESLVKRIAKRYRFSRRETKLLAHLVRRHMYPHYLAGEDRLTKRALNRYLRRNDVLAFPLVVIAIADAQASPPADWGIDKYFELLEHLDALKKEKESKPQKKLVTGKDLIDLGLKPGPIFSKILEEIDDLRAEGKIKTREEALERLGQIIRELKGEVVS